MNLSSSRTCKCKLNLMTESQTKSFQIQTAYMFDRDSFISSKASTYVNMAADFVSELIGFQQGNLS